MLFLLLLSHCASLPTVAGEVWRSDHENGSISFSDSPPQDGNFYRFAVDGDPPQTRHVNLKNFPLLDTWDPLIVAAADKYKVDKAFIKAVILAESGMNPGARSQAGAMGLMQLMPPTASDLGVSDPWDPAQNIDGGVRYLRMVLTMFQGDRRLALAGYNAGPNLVKRLQAVPNFKETQTYVKRVMGLHAYFRTERPVKWRPIKESP
jgi:soluble lytic murein transglycosylase-like protein